MKKSYIIYSLLLALMVVSGCGGVGKTAATKTEPIKVTEGGKPNKILVVYYSVPEATSPSNMTKEGENSSVVVNNKVLGNNQYVAGIISKALGADEFRIETVKQYPIADHRAFINEAEQELKKGVRPALKAEPKDLAQYNIVFLGYPNWWGTMPPALFTFLEKNDLSGKTVIPFNTHGGSGFSDTIETIKKLQPKAKVIEDGLSIHRDDVEGSEDKIKAWLEKLGFKL